MPKQGDLPPVAYKILDLARGADSRGSAVDPANTRISGTFLRVVSADARAARQDVNHRVKAHPPIQNRKLLIHVLSSAP
jgi:hypothetical protein